MSLRFLSALAFAVPALAGCLVAAPAKADFRVCNNSSGRVGVAIGYYDGQGWVTEGWFNMRANRCDVILKGDLAASYYYLHAVDYDRGGQWSGKAFMCTREREFTIRGSDNCLARGYDRTGFIEINTGQQRNWTVELNETDRQPGTR